MAAACAQPQPQSVGLPGLCDTDPPSRCSVFGSNQGHEQSLSLHVAHLPVQQHQNPVGSPHEVAGLRLHAQIGNLQLKSGRDSIVPCTEAWTHRLGRRRRNPLPARQDRSPMKRGGGSSSRSGTGSAAGRTRSASPYGTGCGVGLAVCLRWHSKMTSLRMGREPGQVRGMGRNHLLISGTLTDFSECFPDILSLAVPVNILAGIH